MDLINERFNINSMKVKKLLDPSLNDEILIKCLLTLALCVTDRVIRIKTSLLILICSRKFFLINHQ